MSTTTPTTTTEQVTQTTYKWKIFEGGVLQAEIQFKDVFADQGNVQTIDSTGAHYKGLGWNGKIPLVFHRDNRHFGSDFKTLHLSDAPRWAPPSVELGPGGLQATAQEARSKIHCNSQDEF